MTDTTLNRYLASGTAAERAAFTPTPGTPASGPDPTYFWFETDTADCYAWNFDTAAWVQIINSGAGVAWGSISGTLSSQADLQAALDAKLASASYTAADVLAKLLTVDGAGSGLDADLLDGQSSAAFAPAGAYAPGGTDVAVADGGTGASDAAGARTNLGLGTIAVLDEATTAQYRANTADKALSTDQTWAAADYVALTDAATVAVDMATGFNFSLTIGGNRTLGAPSNTKNGQTGAIVITQDGTGSRTLAYHANWKFAGGTDPVLSTAAGAVDVLFYQVVNSSFIVASLNKAFA